MSEMANLLGLPMSFEFCGQTYCIGARDFEVEAAMETFLEEQSLRTIQQFEGKFSTEEYRAQMDGWRRDVTANVWAFGTEGFARYYQSPEGARRAAYLQLKKHNKDVSLDLIEQIYEHRDESGERSKWVELVEKMSAVNADPNRIRAAGR